MREGNHDLALPFPRWPELIEITRGISPALCKTRPHLGVFRRSPFGPAAY